MNCLHCGDCCTKLSADTCPNLKQHGDFYFCGSYGDRPEDCARYSHPTDVCPVGVKKLAITSSRELRRRLDIGHALLKHGELGDGTGVTVRVTTHFPWEGQGKGSREAEPAEPLMTTGSVRGVLSRP